MRVCVCVIEREREREKGIFILVEIAISQSAPIRDLSSLVLRSTELCWSSMESKSCLDLALEQILFSNKEMASVVSKRRLVQVHTSKARSSI